MQFGEMMHRLYPKIPIDQPSAPDSVHAFMPTAIASGDYYPWLATADRAETPARVNGEACLTVMQSARPVPKEFVPEWIRIGGYTKPRKWPEGLPQVMPDFYAVGSGCIVSSEVRAVLEALAPGIIEYIEITVETPRGMQRATAYYYINVLPKAQMLDWSKADSWKWYEGQVAQTLSENSRRVVFKPMTVADPLMWHEMSLDENRQSRQEMVLVRGKVWNELIKHFPMQLKQQCLTDPSQN